MSRTGKHSPRCAVAAVAGVAVVLTEDSAQGKGGIGLVIDLTKTDRYYDKYLFERKKVEYCKIPCEGYGAPAHGRAL